MSARPIIFLDIEGVLVTENYEAECEKDINKVFIEFDGDSRERFDPICVENLKIILEKTNAVIVVTSTWRLGLGISGLIKLFECYGIYDVIIGVTTFKLVKKTKCEISRGFEIKHWLIKNKDMEGIDTKNFIILDDQNDMNNLTKHLILTLHKNGITSEIRETVIQRLTLKKFF